MQPKLLKGKFKSAVVACDHAGLNLKNALIPFLKLINLETINLGIDYTAPVDYPDIANLLCNFVTKHWPYCFGILLCGSGIGMSIAANKHKLIRAALCPDENYARLARSHNDANVLTLGGRLLTLEQARPIVYTFCNTDFDGGRHATRVGKLGIICS